MVIGHWVLDIGQAERSPSNQELRLLQEQRDFVRSDKKGAFTQCAAGIAKTYISA